MTVEETIKRVDSLEMASHDLLTQDRLLAAEVLLRCARTGIEIEEALDVVDPDFELSEAANEIVRLHSKEPLDGILSIVTYLILQLT